MDQQGQAIRQKRLKAGTACTNCRRKKLRCTGTPNCARCVAHNLDCVVDEALFLKTNSPSNIYARPPSQSSSSSSSLHHSHPHQYRPKSSNSHQMPYGQHDLGSMSSSSYSGDEMFDRGDHQEYLSDRRMSASSSTSFSSLSPSPSPAYSYNYTQSQSYSNTHPYQSSSSSSKKHSSSSSSSSKKPSSYRSDSGANHLDSHPSSSSSRTYSPSFNTTSHDSGSMPQSSMNMNKKRVSKDQDTMRSKQKRRDSRPSRDSDPGSPSPLLSPVDSTSAEGSSSSGANKGGEDLKSVVSTLSLDGHGQHFHGSSSGFYVCQLSSRYRQGVYPLPMAHLNDSDLWSHSLQMTSENELPPKAEMDNLLSLYFRYMYPFAPMFIRKTFMDQLAAGRPDLSQILILNAIFCNACWYSDDPMIKQDSTKYFNRAKIILDETYHVSRVSTVQALLLMSHHQYAVGNYSGGWLYTGMATRISHDIGLHRQDVHVNEPEEAEVRRRVWWAVYIADRLGGGVLGRPLILRDKEYNVQLPSDDWIDELGWDDAVEYPYEPERIISCRLLWAVKLFMQMGNVLNAMHCIEAEVNGAFLADISRTQLPQLHNSLTSWFLSLPNELMYTPYTMSPNSNHPPSPPTALMHMFYYTTLTMLHRPYLRPVNSAAIDPNFLVSSRNICTAAATNVCHIADSLMLHGQLRDTCYYGMACLLAAGTVHVHNAITPTPSNRETTRAGLSKTVKAAHELVKTFPVAESLIAVALDVFASQTSSVPTEMAASFIDISTFVAPFMDVTQMQATSIGNIYEAARLAKLAKDGPGPSPSMQLRHPYGNFSMPLPEGGKDQNSTKLSSLWQNQIAAAVAMAAIAFGGTDPQQEQQFFANPLELPEALRLAPIDSMLFQVDGTTGLNTFGADTLLGQLQTTPPTTTATSAASTAHLLQYQHQQTVQPQPHIQPQPQAVQQQAPPPPPPQPQPAQSSIPMTPSSSIFGNSNSFINLIQAALTSSLQANNVQQQQQYQQQQQQQQQQQPQQQQQQQQQHQQQHQHQQHQPQPQQTQAPQQQHAVMEDDTADPPSPPAISPDDMDMERASLSSDTPSPMSAPISVSRGTGSAPRQDAQTQCDTPSDYSPDGSTTSHESFISSLSEDPDHHDLPFFINDHGEGLNRAQQQQQQQQQQQHQQNQHQMKEGYGCHKDMDKVNSLLFDGQAMEC